MDCSRANVLHAPEVLERAYALEAGTAIQSEVLDRLAFRQGRSKFWARGSKDCHNVFCSRGSNMHETGIVSHGYRS